MERPKHPAVIVDTPSATNGYRWVVLTDGGEYHNLSGAGAPKDGAKGDRGYVQYTVGRNYGLYFWHKE